MLDVVFGIFYFLIVAYSIYNLRGGKVRQVGKRKVDVGIFSYNEEEEMVIETARSWKGIGDVYVVRDGEIGKLKELEKEGIKVVDRESKEGGKAGAINYFVEKIAKHDVLIVDADERLKDKECLERLLRAEGDVVVGMKSFEGKGLLGKAMQLTNEMFRVPQLGLGREGKAFFNGSLGIISLKVAREVKFRDVVIEDIDFSIRALNKGYKIRFVDCIPALGKQPSFRAFLSQQLRYSYGNGEVIRKNEIKDWKLKVWIWFLPLFSLFQTGVLVASFFHPSFLGIELLLTYPLFWKALGRKNLLEYLATFGLNLVLLPPFRVAYTLLGLVGAKVRFGGTHG